MRFSRSLRSPAPLLFNPPNVPVAACPKLGFAVFVGSPIPHTLRGRSGGSEVLPGSHPVIRSAPKTI
jgi:hypothetical protein